MKRILAIMAMGAIPFMSYGQDESRTQNFFVADEGQFFVEGGYRTFYTKAEFESQYDLDDQDSSAMNYNLIGQYGVHSNLNIGLEAGYSIGDGYEGMGDHRLFARGQKGIFLYGLNYFYSHEDSADDNAVSGANHLSIDLGLFKNSFGALLNYQPGYTAEYEDGEDVDQGAQTRLEGFYEHQAGEHAFGAGIGRYSILESDDTSDDLDFNYLKGYAAIELGQVTLLPRLYYYVLSDPPTGIDDYTMTQLELQARYAF